MKADSARQQFGEWPILDETEAPHSFNATTIKSDNEMEC